MTFAETGETGIQNVDPSYSSSGAPSMSEYFPSNEMTVRSLPWNSADVLFESDLVLSSSKISTDPVSEGNGVMEPVTEANIIPEITLELPPMADPDIHFNVHEANVNVLPPSEEPQSRVQSQNFETTQKEFSEGLNPSTPSKSTVFDLPMLNDTMGEAAATEPTHINSTVSPPPINHTGSSMKSFLEEFIVR